MPSDSLTFPDRRDFGVIAAIDNTRDDSGGPVRPVEAAYPPALQVKRHLKSASDGGLMTLSLSRF